MQGCCSMPPDAPDAMADRDDLARTGHDGVGVEAVFQGAVEALPLQAPASRLVEEEDGAAVVVVLDAAIGQEGLDGERRNGPLAHTGAGVDGERQICHLGPPSDSGVTESPLFAGDWLRR